MCINIKQNHFYQFSLIRTTWCLGLYTRNLLLSKFIDINECLPNNGHGPCQGECRNFDGGYECGCTEIPGHKLAPDNHTCEDIDECAEKNAGCSHECLNTPGSVLCLCPDGYYLTNDYKTCEGRLIYLPLRLKYAYVHTKFQ